MKNRKRKCLKIHSGWEYAACKSILQTYELIVFGYIAKHQTKRHLIQINIAKHASK